MTTGTPYRIACPGCKQLNLDKIRGFDDMGPGELRESTRNCEHCGRLVRYWARFEATLEAELDLRCE